MKTLTDATNLQIALIYLEVLVIVTLLTSPKLTARRTDYQILKELALNQLQQSTTGRPGPVGGGGLQATASGGMHIQLLT